MKIKRIEEFVIRLTKQEATDLYSILNKTNLSCYADTFYNLHQALG